LKNENLKNENLVNVIKNIRLEKEVEITGIKRF